MKHVKSGEIVLPVGRDVLPSLEHPAPPMRHRVVYLLLLLGAGWCAVYGAWHWVTSWGLWPW